MKQKINCNWHRYVDLGLPSGLLWATCNIGAKEPWERGIYFSWGNADGYAYGSGYDFSETEYATTPGASLIVSIPVDEGYDAARANLGGSWRMPTTDEFAELFNTGYTTNKWTTQNGINGRLVTSRINGNSVFFPAAGYYRTTLKFEGTYGDYWSSSFISEISAYNLSFGSGGTYPLSSCCRFYGFPVRAVLDHPKDSLLIKAIKR